MPDMSHSENLDDVEGNQGGVVDLESSSQQLSQQPEVTGMDNVEPEMEHSHLELIEEDHEDSSAHLEEE